MPAPTILAAIVGQLVEYGHQRGLDPGQLCQIARVSPEMLRSPGLHSSVTGIYDLLAHIIRTLDDPGVPVHSATITQMEDLHVMGFAVMTATNGDEAARRAVRYARLLTNAGRWELIREPECGILRFHRDAVHSMEYGDRLGLRAANESAIAHFVHCSRVCTGSDYTPLSVSFRHKAPPDTAAHREFFRCPIEFHGDYNEFRVANDFFERAPLTANPAMSHFFYEHAESLLAQREQEDSLRDRVCREIARQLPSGQLTLASVAKSLAVSERSLRRYLSVEKTSFSQLLADVRFERAQSLLGASEISMDQVAFLLGFSGVSAFSRAFKKWSGSSPSAFRSAGAAGSSQARALDQSSSAPS